MGLWRDIYGPRSPEFIDGVAAGMEMFAIWDGGEQLIGARRTPLPIAIKEMREDFEEGGD